MEIKNKARKGKISLTVVSGEYGESVQIQRSVQKEGKWENKSLYIKKEELENLKECIKQLEKGEEDKSSPSIKEEVFQDG